MVLCLGPTMPKIPVCAILTTPAGGSGVACIIPIGHSAPRRLWSRDQMRGGFVAETLIIGMGISAVAYLQSMGSGDTITALGGPELWSKVDPTHKMGQPAPLLTGNLLPGQRGFEQPPKLGENFMEARDFKALLEKSLAAKQTAVMSGECVDQITWSGNKYTVKMEVPKGNKKKLTRDFDKVIIASGPGPARPLMAGDDGKLEVDVNKTKGFVVGGTEFMSPTWTPPISSPCPRVAVYGGSATASWAVELAILRGYKVELWFTRPGDSKRDGAGAWDAKKRFNEAFPPGDRNKGVEEDTKNVRKVLRLVGVRYHDVGIASFVMLELRDEKDQKVLEPVDLFIYALGAEHAATAGIRKILSMDILNSLVPYYDKNQAISSKPALLAVGTPPDAKTGSNGSLMIVGSAMSSGAGFKLEELTEKLNQEQKALIGNLASYKEISDSLPAAARPTEGIAMVMHGIEALNNFIPATAKLGGKTKTFTPPQTITARPTSDKQPAFESVNPNRNQPTTHAVEFDWDINFNTSNRTQLAAWLAQTTDLHPLEANIVVALIVALRGKSRNPLGLTNDQVDFIVRYGAAFANAQLKYNDGLEQRRLNYDKQYGADWYPNLAVKLLTDEYKADFEQKGIQVT